ncbi:hypothetical protein PYW08_007471 [Mythimna loreyi]|uniref:Uncharacterized protein n=1 Tax=Mythimna loreyi TaxID=667449 RepID=A0ACC2QEH6_9NEOP|nr:hypothetical protein PYW08_007471 [Mythimna loreyi]
MSGVTFKFSQVKPSGESFCSSGDKCRLTGNVRNKAENEKRDESESNQLVMIKHVKPDRRPRLCLSYLSSTLLACVLEDCLTQMRILSECNNELRIMKTMSDMGLLLALKFQVKQQDNEDELDKINPNDLGCSQYKLDKLFNDRKFIIDTLQKTYVDLVLNRCYTSLLDINKNIEDLVKYRAKLEEEEAKNKLTRREMRKELRQQRNYIKTVMYDTDLTITHLKSQVEDTELNAEIRSRYVENWQLARTEQHKLTIFEKENGPTKSINYYRERSDQEQRIHSEVELLVNIFINDILTKVDNWMTKYDVDIEAQDLKIAIMKNKYQDAMEKRIDMEQMLAEHEELMKNWLQFKAERQEARNYIEKMTNSAIIVQAWWRGLLVRLQIGPYKPAKRQRQKQPEPEEGKKKKKKKK